MVEILTVVAIIAVLAFVGFPALQRALETANNGKCKANLKTLASACLAYAADNNGYLPANGPQDNNRPQSHVEGGGWIGSDLYALATRRVAVVIPEILEKHNNP